jgi:predicted alpha/beta superfamily hydrolase
MHDGQELFEKSIASYREWKVDETLDELIRAEKVEEMIVVGIYNSSNRTEEYVPYIDPWIITELNVDSSGAKEFSGFVVDNIIPFIDTNYRTIPKRKYFWNGLPQRVIAPYAYRCLARKCLE